MLEQLNELLSHRRADERGRHERRRAALHAAVGGAGRAPAPARRRRHRGRSSATPTSRARRRSRDGLFLVPQGDRMSRARRTHDGRRRSCGARAGARRELSRASRSRRTSARTRFARSRAARRVARDRRRTRRSRRRRRRRAAAPRGDAGPLLGVPIAHKDIFVTRDLPTTAGSRMLAGYREPVRRDRRRPPRRRRHGDARQAQLRRVRDGLEQRELGLARRAQSVGRDARAGRLVGRLGGGGRGAPAARRRPAPTPAARSASRRASAASPASSRPTASARATA